MHQQDKLLVGKHVKQKAYIESGKVITDNPTQNAIWVWHKTFVFPVRIAKGLIKQLTTRLPVRCFLRNVRQ